jgi:exonuclease SbcC
MSPIDSNKLCLSELSGQAPERKGGGIGVGLVELVESNSGKVRLDSIFVDEGFGSLGAENGGRTLEQVLGVLSSLVSANRAVGLISHVQLVQDAVPNGFYVRKTQSGSHVEARGAL